MGSWVDYYRRHARGTSALPADQVPPLPPYVSPAVGTFADDGDNPLDAWEVSVPGEIRLVEGFSREDLPDPCRLESSRKRKRSDEPSGGALGYAFCLLFMYDRCRSLPCKNICK